MSHIKAVEPFSDVHREHGKARAVLLHDPTVEGLDMAIYMDASGSMSEEYRYKRVGGGLWGWLTGQKAQVLPNTVEPQVQWMLEYLATKDRNGLLRVAYWATKDGKGVEAIGELQGKDVKQYKFPGPQRLGGATYLLPAVKDYVAYLKEQVPKGAKRGCAVMVTDGQLHDAAEVIRYTKEIAHEMQIGRLPRTNFVLVGVGDQVDEEQMEEIAEGEYKGVGHLWCSRIAKEITQVAELVAVLVDETMTVAAGGTITDQKGKILKSYEGRLPAVLEFDCPDDVKSFTLEVNGTKYTQPLPPPGEDDHHGDDDDDDDDDHH